MLNLFKEIEGILGVKASFAYVQGLGLIYADLPPEYSPIFLGQIEIFIDQQRQTAKDCKTDISSMEIRFDEALIITKELGSQATLIIIAEPQINLGLLDVTFDLLAEELQQAAKEIQDDPGKILRNENKTSTTANKQQSWTDLPIPPALKPAISEIQHILSKTIGPLSNVIMFDSVKSWEKVGASEAGRINELIDILGMEIGDSALEARFRKTIQPVLLKLFSNSKALNTSHKSTGSSNKIMVSTALAKKLSRLMELFTEFIGSKGSALMKIKLRQWAEIGTPSEQRIPMLIAMLAEEINDPVQKEEFRRKSL